MPESFNQNSESPASTKPESTSKRPLGKKAPSENEDWLLEFVKILGTSLVLALGIRTFIAEARYIPSSSMEPTLQINDRLIIEKITYHLRPPQRGDIVVFKPTPTLQSANFKEAFIKRVVAIPGDKVEMRKGDLYVNNQLKVENYIASKPECPNFVIDPNERKKCTLVPQTIPPGNYLVLGDNRNNSYDSRFWGLVPQDYIIGRAAVRFWPLNRLELLNSSTDK